MFKNILNYFTQLGKAKWVKGAELAFMGAAGAALISTMTAGAFPLTIAALTPIAKVGVIAGLSYLLHPVAGAQPIAPAEPAKPEAATVTSEIKTN